MALIFVPQYELKFDTTSGSDIAWEVDILRSYDDDFPAPSWVSNPVKSLIGSDNPIEIRYERDYDIYKPIQGSTAQLNIVATEAGQYDDFSNGNPYEYQLRLRYRDSSDTLQDYWCGLFTPLDSIEAVTTFPFELSYTAVDGLGLLEQSAPERSYDDSSVNAFSTFIVPALRQTGLDLDIRVQSELITDGTLVEAVSSATVSNFARWKSLEESGELFTHKELLEGYLSAFNCKITQANGHWYIYNGSLLADSTTWKVFNSQGIAQADAVESLLLNVTGLDGEDITPASGDLQINLRRPVGSVECQPTNLVERQFARNGNFDNDLDGWTFTGDSSQGAIITEPDGNKKFTLFQNYFSSDTLFNNVPFTNTDGFAIDRFADVEVKFDWIPEKIFEDAVELYWQVEASFDSETLPILGFPTGFSSGTYSTSYLSSYRGFNYVQNAATNCLFWSVDKEEWVTGSSRTNGTHFKESASEIGDVLNVSRTFRNPTTFLNEFGQASAENLRFKVNFFYLSSRDGKRRDGSSTSRVRASIDNISVKSMFANDVISPTFERVQGSFNTSQRYEPLFASSISDAIYQKLTPTTYKRVGNASDSTTSKSLERIGTQLKLNDYKSQFKYYEGSFINNTSTPLSNINKILLNWAAVGYTETAGGIMNGGTFSPKYNKFDTSFYIPNQATDIAPGDYSSITGIGYSEVNVDLIPATFPGRSDKVAYTLAFRVDATDAANAVIANGLVPEIPFVTLTGSPGEVRQYNLNLLPLTGYIGVTGSTVISADSDSTPLPEFCTFGAFANIQGNISLPITITFPESSEFEELFIEGSVIEFTAEEVPGVTPASVVVTNSGSNLKSPATVTYDTSGLPGSVVHFTHHVNPVDDNFQLFAGNFDATYSDNSLTNLDAAGALNSVAIDFAYTVPTTTESVSVTVTGNATPAGTVGVDLFTRTVNFGTSPTGASFHEGSNTFTGVPGATQDYFITIIPDDDKFIASAPTVSLPSGVTANGTPFKAGENWEVPIQVAIPSSNDTVNASISAVVTEEPYSLTFNINDIGISNAMISTDDAVHRLTFDDGDFGDSITPFVININPIEGHMFASANDILVDVNESSVVIADGSTITLPESQFVSNNQVVSGAMAVTVSGNYPSMGGQYTLDVNVVGGNSLGGPMTGPATTATIQPGRTPLGYQGGEFPITVDANGDYSVRLTLKNGSADTTGSASYTDPSVSIGGNQSGAVSKSFTWGPTTGTSGESVVFVDVPTFTFNSVGTYAASTGAANSVTTSRDPVTAFIEIISSGSVISSATTTVQNPTSGDGFHLINWYGSEESGNAITRVTSGLFPNVTFQLTFP